MQRYDRNVYSTYTEVIDHFYLRVCEGSSALEHVLKMNFSNYENKVNAPVCIHVRYS